MPGFEVVRHHAKTLLRAGEQLVEQMSIHSDTGSHHKIACTAVPAQVEKRDSSQSDAALLGRKSGLRGGWNLEWQPKIMREGVGGSEGSIPNATGVVASTCAMLLMVPSPPQAKTVSHPSDIA